jgi:GT2 family glycosyltransferase
MTPVLAPAAPPGLRPGPRPAFSVVIPAYQAAATIGEAIASVRSQTAPAVEILVCDDGSTDDLEGALEEHRGEVTMIRRTHAGVSAARNALLEAASGDFVLPLDADDVYAPTRLERLAELAEARPDLDILSTDADFVVDGRVVGHFHAATPFPVERQLERIFERCFLICPAMRRKRLVAIGGYDEALSSAEDWDVAIRLIQAGARAALVDEPLLEYRLGSSSLTSSRVDTLSERVRVLEKAAASSGHDGPARRAAERALSVHRARALQHAAREAVLEGDPGARSRLLEVARSRHVAPRARVGALAASIAPSRSRRVVETTLSESSGRPLG